MKGLFEDYKNCRICGKRLPNNYDEELCPNCYEVELFAQVKEYIRNNSVNEYQVASHFGISKRLVKKWIQQGRIEYYLDESINNNCLVMCLECGVPLCRDNKGLLCPRCQIKHDTMKGFSSVDAGKGKMRFRREH